MLKGQALNQFLLKKTCITWDSVPIQDAAIIDLRNDSLNLLDYGMLKRAAVLLFHHNPKKWISRSYITIRYFETDSELRYQDEIHGSLLSQADKIIDLVFTKYLKAEISYQGVTRIETYPFPKEAIREAGNPMPEYVVNSIPMRILKVIRDNPTLSQSQIAEMLGEKHDTIKYHMRKLRLSGIIKRVGSSQKGKWIDSRKVN